MQRKAGDLWRSSHAPGASVHILAFIVSSYSPTLTELARPRNNPKAYVVLTVEDTLQIIAKVDKRKFKP